MNGLVFKRLYDDGTTAGLIHVNRPTASAKIDTAKKRLYGDTSVIWIH